ILVLALLPASMVIGLVKPDLFDIDRAVRRTLVYAVMWTAIGAGYVGVTAALGLAASSQGLQVTVLVTILATALFAPVRRRLAGAPPDGRTARRSAGRPRSGCSGTPWIIRANPGS
ncbi:MAG: hypothetical protein M3445_05885, partial [Actinomycetota bacterium]|nr:hypothetical protein [Actinomycetota bacterium]